MSSVLNWIKSNDTSIVWMVTSTICGAISIPTTTNNLILDAVGGAAVALIVSAFYTLYLLKGGPDTRKVVSLITLVAVILCLWYFGLAFAVYGFYAGSLGLFVASIWGGMRGSK